MKIIKKLPFACLLLLGIILSYSVPGFSADQKNSSTAASMTPEIKKDMADMYAKMSDCMKADKSMEQCQNEVMKDCPVMKKTGHCPIMDGMKPMMGKGMMKEKMKGKGMDHSENH